MVKGSEAEDVVEELLRGERGAGDGDVRNPDGRNQWINRNNVTVNPPDDHNLSDTIPFETTPKPRVRDYSRESIASASADFFAGREKREPVKKC